MEKRLHELKCKKWRETVKESNKELSNEKNINKFIGNWIYEVGQVFGSIYVVIKFESVSNSNPI